MAESRPPAPANRNWTLPNLLTYGRVAAVPVVVGASVLADERLGALDARSRSTSPPAITDFFDGYLARAWSQQSSLGRMLDPIADKLLVAAVLLMLAADRTIAGPALWAAIVILCREILVSGLREYLAELRVSVPVTAVAKWKTDGAIGRARLSHRRAGRRAVLPRATMIGRRAAVDRRDPDALHRLGLYEGELRPCRRRERR